MGNGFDRSVISKPSKEKALVLLPILKKEPLGSRSVSARLLESEGLVCALDVSLCHSEALLLSNIKPSTYIGQGVVDRLKPLIEEEDVALIVIDAQLSPIQQRNLETAFEAKVIDRTGLIIEIFGDRAQTKEGKLQVELAALTYQRSRLVRSWTHLERQRGGVGFMGGPGESQLEIDRRLISERLKRIKMDLDKVRSTRSLHRQARRKVPYPIVALVGYTNAGKSTLFNRLTQASVLEKDMLFATLDPTLREVSLPSGKSVLLSDTVGFISDLPHELIEAFKATLEEVIEADLVLHVRDITHPDSEAQKQDVLDVLKTLLGTEMDYDAFLEVLNKSDLLEADQHKAGLLCSAVTGEGCDALLAHIDSYFDERRKERKVFIGYQDDGRLLAWAHAHGQVTKTEDEQNEGFVVSLRLDPNDIGRFEVLVKENAHARFL